MPGRPKTRARRQEQRERKGHKVNPQGPRHQYLADIYANKYTTFDALRTAMVQNGIVDHGINPYDVIQRAIDDTTTDYLLIRRQLDKDSHGDPQAIVTHPLYDYMEHMREAMVRYSTFAMQYDIQKRQLKLSESRIALLAVTLKTVLTNLGLTQEQIKQAPKLLIDAITDQEPKTQTLTGPTKIDTNKAEALAEILSHDSDVTIELVDEPT